MSASVRVSLLYTTELQGKRKQLTTLLRNYLLSHVTLVQQAAMMDGNQKNGKTKVVTVEMKTVENLCVLKDKFLRDQRMCRSNQERSRVV